MRYRVRDARLKAVRLSSEGPNGKGVVSASFAVQGPTLAKYVDIPDFDDDHPYALDLLSRIEDGTLLPPVK